MIIDKVNGQPVPRYLIYDIIKFNVSSPSEAVSLCGPCVVNQQLLLPAPFNVLFTRGEFNRGNCYFAVMFHQPSVEYIISARCGMKALMGFPYPEV